MENEKSKIIRIVIGVIFIIIVLIIGINRDKEIKRARQELNAISTSTPSTVIK